MLGYFATGLTWTVYATMVDDTVGNMGGYTAVVYQGTTSEDEPSDSENTSNNEEDQDDIPIVVDTMGLRIMSYYPGIYSDDYSGVYISDVRDLYEKKDAEVVTIDTQSILNSEPQILHAGNKVIGVFGAKSYVTKPALKKIVAGLKDKGADVIICVTKRMALLSSLEGIDVVILTDNSEEYSVTGTREGDTLIVQAPKTGEAGVVLFSSNNIASARSIDAL
ncbi:MULTISPECIES: hypothetical protein [unclassified Adlercreutzia]|uniref:hypothetical protein n=1 Tax=unclassified Adlercreutzia TaxID=2636013 RepID=UPI0013EA1060|nr:MULTISPECIES: hypothetical protein [unclassified Adlercreutzia]